jgi:hypothetical protein
MGSIYAKDDYEVAHPADCSGNNVVEFKLSDKKQNGATVTESNAAKGYIRVDLMKHTPHVQDLLTFDYIDGLPASARSTEKKVSWDIKLMERREITVQWDRHDADTVERSAARDPIRYPTFYKNDVSHWSTNRRHTTA